MNKKLIEYLLENAGPVIQYRLRKEVLQTISKEEAHKLQEQIINKPKVKKIIDKRQPDGWIGSELHGVPGKGLDACVSLLVDNGIEKDSELLQGVVDALLSEKDETPYRTTFKGGEVLDLGGRGGNKAVKAGILANIGKEDCLLVQDEIRTSLCYLRDCLEYRTIDDFSLVNKRGVRYYKSDTHFPGANHLALLSATQSWRNTENIELVKKAMVHCMDIMKGQSHNIMFRSSSHFIGPFNFNWNLAEFNINEIQQDSYALVWWLRNLYGLSKIGVIKEVPELKKAYDYLYELVISQDIVNKQNEASLKRFKDILSVENSWRKKENAFCDIMFYGVMILYYAGYDVENIYV